MKILLINGSATQLSATRGLSRAFARTVQSRKAELLQFDVGQDMLPVFTGRPEEKSHPAVKKLQAYAEQADGFIICTPEYHNSMSGALKNALDYLSSKQFRRKPVAMGAAAGGGKGGINALNSLRQVLRGVYAIVLPDQIVVDPEHFDDQLRLVQEDALNRVEGITDELIEITSMLRREQASTSHLS